MTGNIEAALDPSSIASNYTSGRTLVKTSPGAAARRLSAEIANMGDVNALSAEQWSDFVNRCETIISEENTSWAAKWTKE
jgi:hypothetical protein